jgi:hypothetical protein
VQRAKRQQNACVKRDNRTVMNERPDLCTFANINEVLQSGSGPGHHERPNMDNSGLTSAQKRKTTAQTLRPSPREKLGKTEQEFGFSIALRRLLPIKWRSFLTECAPSRNCR